MHLTVLNQNLLRSAVQHEPIYRFDLAGDHRSAGLHIRQHDLSSLVCVVDSVIGTHRRAAAVDHLECDPGKRLILGALDELADNEGRAGRVVKMERLNVIGVDHYRLRFFVGVDGVAGNGLDFGYHQRAYHPVDGDFTVPVGHIDAVAADLAVFVGDELTGGGRHLEGHAGQGLIGDGIPFVDDQCASLGIFHNHRLSVAVGANHHVCGGIVDHISAVRRLDFGQYIRPWGEVGDADLTLAICGENPILGERTGANHTVQAHLAASRRCDTELRAGKRLVGQAVPFLDNELALGLVFHGHADRLSRLDHSGLGLGVDQESSGGFGFGDDNALAGGQALDAHLAVFI